MFFVNPDLSLYPLVADSNPIICTLQKNADKLDTGTCGAKRHHLYHLWKTFRHLVGGPKPHHIIQSRKNWIRIPQDLPLKLPKNMVLHVFPIYLLYHIRILNLYSPGLCCFPSLVLRSGSFLCSGAHGGHGAAAPFPEPWGAWGACGNGGEETQGKTLQVAWYLPQSW